MLVHQVPRFRARRELGVEAMQALDLEERVGERDSPAEQPLASPLRPLEPAPEGREVQRDLATPRSFSASIERTTTNSVRPFGVSRSRRISDRDIAGRP